MENTGTTGTAQEDDSSLSDSQPKRKRSMWSKQKGLRRPSCDPTSRSHSDSLLTGISERKGSNCSVLDHVDFFGEKFVGSLL